MINVLRKARSQLVPTGILLLLMLFCPESSILAASFHIAEPFIPAVKSDQPVTSDARKSQDPDHYERRGQIQVAANVLARAQELEPGDLLNLKLFPDKPYRIVVQSRHEKASGIVTITGQVEDHEMETFTMTLNAEHYTITLQDLITDKSYWIAGETGPGRGSVLEVNQKARPPRFE